MRSALSPRRRLLISSAASQVRSGSSSRGLSGQLYPYATVNRADERKQVVKIFANDVALASARTARPWTAARCW